MRAKSIAPVRLDWLWFPYVPLGKITALAGQMGQAKSLATIWLAASVTGGSRALGLDGYAGSVLMLNAEDDAGDTIVPRLMAAGADLDRVWIEPQVTLSIDRITQACDEMRDVRLITIDPVQAFLPSSVNSWKGQDVRAALEPLRVLASDRKLAVVVVQHLNRRTDAGGDPLARIGDSQGITQLARSVLIWGPDPADPDGNSGRYKALTRAKANLAKASASATFEISERVVTAELVAPTLVRGADRVIDAGEVVTDNDERSAHTEAEAWLRERLADGPQQAKDILRDARADGIAEKTLRRAKVTLRVKSEQHRSDDRIGGWVWSLDASGYTPDHVDHLGHVDHLDLRGQGAQGGLDSHTNGNARHLHAEDIS